MTDIPYDQPAPSTDDWEHREAAKKANGLYTNQVFAQHLGDGLIRLSFGELLDEEPKYHSAVVISARNARKVAALINSMADEILGAQVRPNALTSAFGG